MFRVLITGFYDWKDLGVPPLIDRCRDNPSGRLLVKKGRGSRGFLGPLALKLKEWLKANSHFKIDLNFQILPVVWDQVDQLKLDEYHQVIHLGLGVYDSFHTFLIEEGAYNLHQGRDALGVLRDTTIQPNAPCILTPNPSTQRGLVRATQIDLPSPFKARTISARSENVYLCNATYYRSLMHLSPQLREAYFIHIPHSEDQDQGDDSLASALLILIQALILTDF